MNESPLFKYLHLLNEARAIDIHDEDLYKKQQKVCDAIEKELGIQQSTNWHTHGCPVVHNHYNYANYTDNPKVDFTKVTCSSGSVIAGQGEYNVKNTISSLSKEAKK